MVIVRLARRAAGLVPGTVAGGLLIVAAAMAPFLGTPSRSAVEIALAPSIAPSLESPSQARGGMASEADGVLPDGVGVFDTVHAGVTRLDSALVDALRRAAKDAARAGIDVMVTSGWRSKEYQEQLFRDALATYGTEDRAAEWVAPPGTSAHESGDAVDIGPLAAETWLARHGDAYGLCQVYRNEPWHFELRPDAIERGCPRMTAHPT